MDFSRPDADKLTNAVIVIADQEFHVCKEFLASHSEYFQDKFFKKPADRLQANFIIETSLEASQFQTLLDHLYHKIVITPWNVSDLLEASNFFQFKTVLKTGLDYLITLSNKKISILKKLLIAEKLEIPELFERVLDQLFTFVSLDTPIEPLRPTTIIRMLERIAEHQKSLTFAPKSLECEWKLRERIQKAEAQGPEAVAQELAIQHVLLAIDPENRHIPMILKLCGLDLSPHDLKVVQWPTRQEEDPIYLLEELTFDDEDD